MKSSWLQLTSPNSLKPPLLEAHRAWKRDESWSLSFFSFMTNLCLICINYLMLIKDPSISWVLRSVQMTCTLTRKLKAWRFSKLAPPWWDAGRQQSGCNCWILQICNFTSLSESSKRGYCQRTSSLVLSLPLTSETDILQTFPFKYVTINFNCLITCTRLYHRKYL